VIQREAGLLRLGRNGTRKRDKGLKNFLEEVSIMTLQRWLQKLAVVLFLSFAMASGALAQQFKRVIFFGDSLSDPGNFFVACRTSLINPCVPFLVPPFLDPIPAAPYAIGGMHFSNGPTWAEQFAQGLHDQTGGSPALLVPQVFNNYAVGRARARAGAPTFPSFDLSTQVGQFVADGKRGSGNDLFVIWIGSNDMGDALLDPQNAGTILMQALTATVANIQVLYANGARNFLIVNLPNLALTPFVRSLGPAAQVGATRIETTYNGLLNGYVSTVLPAVLPGTKFIYLDANAVLEEIVADPAASHMQDVTDSCLTFDVTAGAFCSEPNTYLFWDGFHPTTAGHSVLAKAALAAIGSNQ
jgi:phospholipase/lecithinase/hemolysin